MSMCAHKLQSMMRANGWIYSIVTLGLYSLSGKMFYHQISWSFEAARLGVMMIISLWNLTGISAVQLPRCLSNFRAIRNDSNQISRIRDFTRSCGKTSVRLVNRGPKVVFACSQTSPCHCHHGEKWLETTEHENAVRYILSDVWKYVANMGK